jgi:Icc-related predicted phosphoesterase
MKIVLISDTHSLHDSMDHLIPDGDLLIHSGDFSNAGREQEIFEFIEWFSNLPHRNKVFISGNHDIMMDGKKTDLVLEKIKEAEKKNTFYLEDSHIVIEGLKIWGHPHVPKITKSRIEWAFTKEFNDMEKVVDRIPEDIDILVSHTPPKGILDVLLTSGANIGCENLYRKIISLKQIKMCCFGHIHESYGCVDRSSIKDNLIFANSAICDFRYRPSRKPLVFEINGDSIDYAD